MGSHPDAELHPEATGPAKVIVDAHRKEQPLKLYSGWLYVLKPYCEASTTSRIDKVLHSCPFVQRAWAVLEGKHCFPHLVVEHSC